MQSKLPDTSRLVFDAKKHAYKLDGNLMTGVTSVLDGTSSKPQLISWSANMAVDHVKAELDEWELDVFPVSVLKALLEEARTAYARKRDKAGAKGTDTHALVEEYINYCVQINDGKPLGDLILTGVRCFRHDGTELVFPKEIHPFAEWAIKNVDNFLSAEQRLYSETHKVAGTADFVAIIDGKLTIGDLKTFPKMWNADPFVQMGAYSLMWNEMTGSQPEQSVIVKMCDPEDERLKKYGGNAFSVYPRYSMKEDEEMFLNRLKTYRYNQAFVSPKD